jgi:hypothetical protein
MADDFLIRPAADTGTDNATRSLNRLIASDRVEGTNVFVARHDNLESVTGPFVALENRSAHAGRWTDMRS